MIYVQTTEKNADTMIDNVSFHISSISYCFATFETLVYSLSQVEFKSVT